MSRWLVRWLVCVCLVVWIGAFRPAPARPQNPAFLATRKSKEGSAPQVTRPVEDQGEAIFYPKLPDPSRPLDDTLSEDAMLYDLFLRQISELNGLPPPEKEAAVEGDPLDAYAGTGSRLTSLSSRTVGPMIPSKHSLVEHAVRLKPECPIEFIYKKRVVLGNFVSWRSATRGAFNVQLTSGEVVAIDVSQVISSWEQLADESVPSTAQQWAQVGTDALALLGNLSPRKSDLQEFWQIVSQRSNSLHIDSMDLGVYIFQERRFRSWINPFAEASDSAVRALSAAQRYAAALLLFNDDFHFRRRPSKLLSSEQAAAAVTLDSQGGGHDGVVGGAAAAGYALEDIMNEQAMRRFKSSTRSPGGGDKAGSPVGADGEQELEDTAVLVLEGGYGVLPENTVQFRESETFHKYYTERVSSGSPLPSSSPSSPSSSSSSTSGNSSPFRAASVTRLLRALELYSLSPASMSPPQQIKGLLKRLGKTGTPDGARMALREMNLHQHSKGSGGVGESARNGSPQTERGQLQSGTPGQALTQRPGQATAAVVGATQPPLMTGPTPWSAEVLASADKLSQEMSARREVLAATEAGRSGKRGAAGRMDYRSSNDVHPIICIDGSKAVFLDDAFSVSPDTGEILVHVVDVAGALRRYEVLQNVAMERVSSTFLPSGPLHMLPPQALAALKLSTAGPNEVITVAIQINAEDGSLLGARVFPSVIGPVFPVDVDTADEILDSVNSGDRDGWSFRLGIPEAVVKDLVMAQRLVQRVIEKQPWVDKSFSAGQHTTQSLNKRTGRYKQALLDKTPGNRMVNALLTLYSNTTVTFCAEKGVNVPLAWENRDRADAQLVRRFATQPLRNWLAQLQQQQLRSALKMELPMTRKDCAMAVAHHNQRRKQMSSQLNAGRDVVSFESLESHCAAVLASGQTDVVLNAEGQGRGGSVKLVDFKVMGTVMGDVARGAQVRVRVRKVVADTRTVILDLVE